MHEGGPDWDTTGPDVLMINHFIGIQDEAGGLEDDKNKDNQEQDYGRTSFLLGMFSRRHCLE